MASKNSNPRRTNSVGGKGKEVPVNKLTALSQKLKNTYILSVFETTKKEDVYLCKVCPNKQTVQYKNLKRHILENLDHENCIKQADQVNHKHLVKILKETKRTYKKQGISDLQNEESYKHKNRYLKFTA